MDDLGELIEQLQALRNNAFCDEDRFLELYRKVCKHIYHKYPELVGEYVHLYRAIWMTNDDED